MELEWNETGQECEPWEFVDLHMLANAMAAHVKPFVAAQRHAEVLINAAETQEEIDEILEEFQKSLEELLSGDSGASIHSPV